MSEQERVTVEQRNRHLSARRRLWSDTVVCGMRAGETTAKAAEVADALLVEFDRRFPASMFGGEPEHSDERA